MKWVTRNGQRLYFNVSYDCFIEYELIRGHEIIRQHRTDNYDENLLRLNRQESDLDIMKVYCQDGTLLFDRDELGSLKLNENDKQTIMKTNEIKIEIPEGFEIDLKNSSLKDGVVKFKYLSDIPFEKIGHDIDGYWISNDDDTLISIEGFKPKTGAKSIFKTEKLAKKSLAIAQISQWIPQYGGEIIDEEWKDMGLCKYAISRQKNKVCLLDVYDTYYFLSFSTAKHRADFLKNHRQLVLDYLMVEE